MSDVRRERLRREEPRLVLPPSWPAGNAAMVGRVVTAPSALGLFFPVNPVTVTGAETVGGAGSFAAGSDQVQVYLLGPSLPSVGDYLVCRFVDFRWVAETGSNVPPWIVHVCVRDCGGAKIVGATVTATGPDSYSASCTTVAYGFSGLDACCDFTVTEAGDYTFSALGDSVTVHVAGSMTVPICTGGNFKICGTLLYGCSVPPYSGIRPYTGATVTATQDGNTIGTGTTDGSGHFCFCVTAVGTHAITLTTPPPDGRYITVPGTVPLIGAFGRPYNSCTTLTTSSSFLADGRTNPAYDAAPGYMFYCCGCADPIPSTLYLTDSFGTLTLTNGAGSHAVSFPGCPPTAPGGNNCPPVTVTISYALGTSRDAFGNITGCFLDIKWSTTGAPDFCPYEGPYSVINEVRVNLTISSCVPFAASSSVGMCPIGVQFNNNINITS